VHPYIYIHTALSLQWVGCFDVDVLLSVQSYRIACRTCMICHRYIAQTLLNDICMIYMNTQRHDCHMTQRGRERYTPCHVHASVVERLTTPTRFLTTPRRPAPIPPDPNRSDPTRGRLRCRVTRPRTQASRLFVRHCLGSGGHFEYPPLASRFLKQTHEFHRIWFPLGREVLETSRTEHSL
jgi:hypothetical protein